MVIHLSIFFLLPIANLFLWHNFKLTGLLYRIIVSLMYLQDWSLNINFVKSSQVRKNINAHLYLQCFGTI